MGILVLMAIGVFMEWNYYQNQNTDEGLFHRLQINQISFTDMPWTDLNSHPW